HLFAEGHRLAWSVDLACAAGYCAVGLAESVAVVWPIPRGPVSRGRPTSAGETIMTPSAAVFGAGRFRYRVQEPWAKVTAKLACKETAAVACDSAGRVYLFTRVPDVVQVYEADGTFVTAWGEGLFSRAHGLFIGQDGTVYCTDDFDHTVRAFTTDGKLK